jgi:hypothetical protein
MDYLLNSKWGIRGGLTYMKAFESEGGFGVIRSPSASPPSFADPDFGQTARLQPGGRPMLVKLVCTALALSLASSGSAQTTVPKKPPVKKAPAPDEGRAENRRPRRNRRHPPPPPPRRPTCDSTPSSSMEPRFQRISTYFKVSGSAIEFRASP